MIRTGKQLESWRERCGFSSWDEAAAALGISRASMYRAKRDADSGRLDKTIGLACEGVEARLSKEGKGHG